MEQKPSGAARRVVAGWSRTTLIVEHGLILDVGSGAFPNIAADVLCDLEVDDDRHRHGLELVIDRPFVVAQVEALPFRDKAFEMVIASHLAEHVTDPGRFCSEISRVAARGYIETPSPIADVLLHEDYHIWRVSQRRGVLRFRRKTPRARAVAAITERVYRGFYAGRPDCSRRTWRLPPGKVGDLLRFLLKVFGAVLNRIGIMHTRYRFDPERSLRWRVDD